MRPTSSLKSGYAAKPAGGAADAKRRRRIYAALVVVLAAPERQVMVAEVLGKQALELIQEMEFHQVLLAQQLNTVAVAMVTTVEQQLEQHDLVQAAWVLQRSQIAVGVAHYLTMLGFVVRVDQVSSLFVMQHRLHVLQSQAPLVQIQF